MSRQHDPDQDRAIRDNHGLGGAQPRELPNNVEAEQALLGAILVNNAAYDRVKKFLEEPHFFEPLHRKIFMVAAELIQMGKMASPVTIKTFLPVNEKVGEITVQHYLARLASEAVTIINAYDYGMVIYDLWERRQLIAAAEKTLNLLYDAPPNIDVVGETTAFEERAALLRAERPKAENRRGHGQQYMDSIAEAQRRGERAGVPLFLPALARLICEPTLAPGNLYGLVASSGEGKTSFVLQMVLHAIQNGHPVLIQSFDQDSNQFMAQMIAQHYAIEARRQAMLKFTPKEHETMAEFSVWIDQQPLRITKFDKQETATQLVAKARDFTRKFNTGKTPLIVTDHIQAITPDEPSGKRRFGDQQQTEGTKVRQINQVIKSGAGQIDAAWIMLNQRNTEGMKRVNPKPIKSDVHGGQAALYSYDTMIYLYRFKQFLEERKKVAAGAKDWADIEKVFPADVRQGADIIEIGTLKVRFGDVFQEPERVDFEGRYTRLKPNPVGTVDQEELAVFAQMA